MTRTHPPVIFTDDGWILGASEPPLSMEQLRQKMVVPYQGTGAALWWSVGDHEVYQYETVVGEIMGDGFSVEDLPETLRRISENTRHLISEYGGPLTALVELSRDADLEFFSRVRMNSHYRTDPESPMYGRFRRDNPSLLIGSGENYPKGSMEWAVRTGLDFTHFEVRQYMANIILEQFERFEVDGVEMDFMRHPMFFRPHEAFSKQYLMTDLVRFVRQKMKETESSTGRQIKLAVRVPPTLINAKLVGLDVSSWISEGLVDIVVVGLGTTPFETNIEEFVRAAEGTNVLVYGCVEASRPAIDESVIRGVASRIWNAGASGVYMYNFYTMSAEWKRKVVEDISDPKKLMGLDRRYELDRTLEPEPLSEEDAARAFIFNIPSDRYVQILSVFRYAIPPVQLPVELGNCLSGVGLVIDIDTYESIENKKCVLELRLENFGSVRELELCLNGQLLQWESGRISYSGWSVLRHEPNYWTKYPTEPVVEDVPGTKVEFDIDPGFLLVGRNKLSVNLSNNDFVQSGPVILRGVGISVHCSDI